MSLDAALSRMRKRREAARATPEVIARATSTAVRQCSARQLRRMARYVIDGWTPTLLRATADAAARAGEEHWLVAAVRCDADTLEAYLTAQKLAGGK